MSPHTWVPPERPNPAIPGDLSSPSNQPLHDTSLSKNPQHLSVKTEIQAVIEVLMCLL